MRTILIVGKSGLGKSTFSNLLTGGDNPVGEGMTGSTNEPITSKLYLDGKCHKVVDFPGFGDVASDSRAPITNEDIHRWILNFVLKEEVVGIVNFVSQEDVVSARLNLDATEFYNMIHSRFYGFEGLCFFAVSGPSMLGDDKEFLFMAIKAMWRGKLKAMGINRTNWARCKNKQFEGVKEWCLRKLTETVPVRLVPRAVQDRCHVCGIKGDPLLVQSPCKVHGSEGTLVHSDRLFHYHASELTSTHLGKWHQQGPLPCFGKFSCCGSGQKDGRCEHVRCPACKGPESSPCRAKCLECNRDTDQEGCQGTCKNCKKMLSEPGCICHKHHDWVKGATSRAILQDTGSMATEDYLACHELSATKTSEQPQPKENISDTKFWKVVEQLSSPGTLEIDSSRETMSLKE
jgi:energy-coupling factor transporter ATP-binding protein EcfA2